MKQIVTSVLLLFVAASVVVVILRNQGAPPEPDHNAVAPINAEHPGALDASQAGSQEALPLRVEVIMFHGLQRCETCNVMEYQAQDVLRTEPFDDPALAQRLTWREMNYDTDNTVEAARFGVASSGIVLRQMRGSEEVGYVNLVRGCWDHVHDIPAFYAFLRDEILGALGEEHDG